MQHYYKSEDPTVVGIVHEYFQARDQFQEELKALGAAFGGAAAPMRDVDSHFAGGHQTSGRSSFGRPLAAPRRARLPQLAT